MERSDLRARTILVLLVAAVFLWMIRSILVPVALGAVFAMVLAPFSAWLGGKLKRMRRLSPLIVTIALLVLVMLPLAGITAQAVVSINAFLGNLDAQDVTDIQSSIVASIRDLADRVGLPTENIRRTTTQVIQRAGTTIATFLSGLLSSVPEAILD